MTTKLNQKSKFDTVLGALITSFTAGLPNNVKSVPVLGVLTSAAGILSKLQSIAALDSAATTARQAATVAVANRNVAMPANSAYVNSLVAALKVLFEGNVAALTALGIQSKPRKAASTTTKAIAQAKGKATRTARGTMGKAQRQTITAVPAPTLTVSGIVPSAVDPSTSLESTPAAPVAAVPAPVAK